MRIGTFPFSVDIFICVSRVLYELMNLSILYELKIHAISTKLVRAKRYMCLVVISCEFFSIRLIGKKNYSKSLKRSQLISGVCLHTFFLLSCSFTPIPISSPHLPKILSIGRPVTTTTANYYYSYY